MRLPRHVRWAPLLIPLLVACGSAQRTAEALEARGARPQLMLVIVIDQLGSEAFAKLEPLLSPEGALRRASSRGLVYERVTYAYAATYTAPGHASIYTGAAPRESGVTSNYWIDRRSGRSRSVVDDGQHTVHGKKGAHAGPDALRVPTIADALKAETGGRGKVVSLSLKDRAAVIPGGKRADLALWYDATARGFTTSTYYAETLPEWVGRFQRRHPTAAPGTVWEAAEPERLAQVLGPDEGPGEGDYKGLGIAFPHRLNEAEDAHSAWRMFPDSSEYLVELALAATRNLGLGEDDATDLLAVSLSGTDYAGHVFGPDSWEYADHLRRADLAIAHLIDTLSSRTRLSVLITSDHGVAPLPEQRKGNGAGHRVTRKEILATARSAVAAVAGEGDWVAGFTAPFVFLAPDALKHPRAPKIRSAVTTALAKHPAIFAAYDTSALGSLHGTSDPIEQRVLQSVHPESSGEVFLVTRPHVFPDVGITPGKGTTHGSPWDYDLHVPVWILAPGVEPARHREPLEQARVAATIARLMGMKPPSHALASPLPGL
ncbi:MAG: alkaline phosphatase family protein [Myxococcales bacterium]|nr:alkaline phosphatase family protein [Myxococcales bacterium]